MDRQQARDLFSKAIKLHEQGEIDKAVDLYIQIIRNYSDFEDALVNLAAAYLQKGRFENAINLLEQVLNKNPDNPVALYNIGKAYFHQNQFLKALYAFERAEEFWDEDIEVKKAIFYALLALNKLNEAIQKIQSIENFFEKLSSDQEILLKIANTLIRLEKYEEAHNLYKKIVSNYPSSIEALEGLIECQLKLKAYDKASTSIKRALLLAPNHPQFHIQTVDLLIAAENQLEDAINYLKKIKQQIPESKEIQNKLEDLQRKMPILQKKALLKAQTNDNKTNNSTTLLLSEDNKSNTIFISKYETQVLDILEALYDKRITPSIAIHELKELLRHEPSDTFISEELAKLYVQIHNYQEALQIYQNLSAQNPQNYNYQLNLAKVLALQGNTQQAELILQQLASKNTSNIDIQLVMAEMKILHKDFDSALVILNNILQNSQTQARALYLKAYILIRQDKLLEAEEPFKILLSLSPLDEEVVVLYSKLCIIKHKPTEALEIWNKFDDGLESVQEIISKVELLLASSQTENIKSMIQKVINFQPHTFDEFILNSKAHFYSGNFYTSSEQFEKALAHEPHNAEIMSYLSLCNLARGKEAKFWLMWQKAIELDSFYPMLLGITLSKVLQPSHAKLLLRETNKLIEISTKNELDKKRLLRMVACYER